MSGERHEVCGNCRYYNDPDGTCRVDSPQLVASWVKVGDVSESEPATMWPAVLKDTDWCGRRKPVVK